MSGLRIFVDFTPAPDVLELLRDGTRGHELVFAAKPAISVLDRPSPDPQFATVDIAFGQPDPHAIVGAPRLKWVQISSSGITRYDNPQFRALMAERRVAVCNSASVYSEACALHALSFILGQARILPLALRSRTANGTAEWHALRAACRPLAGQTVLIIGYGAIGKRLTELLKPFHVRVIAFRRKPRGDEGIPMVNADELNDALAKEADHVVNILPDSAETRRFFDAKRFEVVKPGTTFYNIGRGTTVDQEALLAVLRSGRLGAAWLDVTDPEPLPDNHPLWAESNCFITPHIAGGHTGEAITLVRHFLGNLDRFVRGEPLLDRVM
jgi:phosphoglycerate dehydrogenase-like enzyme